MKNYRISIILAILILGISLTNTHAQDRALSSLKNHKTIHLKGGSEELSDYPVMINIAGNFKDIHFTDGNGKSLFYYLEDGIFSGGRNYWVKVPQIPNQGTTINFYYNPAVKGENLPNALSDSYLDPEKVFLFFDDFTGEELNEEKWIQRCELKGNAGLNNGCLKLRDCGITSRSFKIKKGILEFKAILQDKSAIQAIAKGRPVKYSSVAAEQIVYSSAYAGAEHAIAVDNVAKVNVSAAIQPSKDYIYKVILNDYGVYFERYNNDYLKEAEVRFLDVAGIDEGYVGLRASGTFLEKGNASFYWIRVRPYTEIEPTVE